MPRTDLPLAELWGWRPELSEPEDLDDFWARTLAKQDEDLDVRLELVHSGLVTIETYDVTFAGHGGDPIRAWLHLPAAGIGRTEPLPGVVQFMGYNGGRGLPHEHTFWAQAGYAHLVMDTRGQGSGWTTGDTPDPTPTGPAQPGFLTRGIASPADHYYTRVYVDAVRAVGVLRSHELVDAGRVAVAGISQGGGIALAVAGLTSGGAAPVTAVLADVPFGCHFRRAVEIAPGDPYAEVARYLAAHRDQVERVFATLGYLDAAVLGRRAVAPALFSVAMMDQICPPSTVFAAYHSYGGPKEIEVYEFNDHEGGDAFQQRRQLDWLAAVLG